MHQKGQLLRKLGTPNFVLDNELVRDASRNQKYGFSFEIDMQIIAIDLLKRRNHAVVPCNESLFDEDNKWIAEASKKVGCIPPFFNTFSSLNSSSGKNMSSVVYASRSKKSTSNLF